MILSLLVLASLSKSNAQSINQDKASLVNFIKRMYQSSPFEGVKIVEDYDHNYLVSVLSLDRSKYSSPSILNRVAQVKAQAQANAYINGSSTSSDLVIKTIELKIGDKTTSVVESLEAIKENSMGFSQGIELLVNFEDEINKRTIFIHYKEITKKNL